MLVAVTTAPRTNCTLLACTQSIIDCGWEPVVFAEPNSTLTPHLTIHHPQKLGVWHNWLYSVKWALTQDSEYIMTVQDDSLFHPESKAYFDSITWPEQAGFVSLYTPKHYTRETGLQRIYTNCLWGACALIFPRHVLEELVAHPVASSWQGVPPRSRNPEVMQRRIDNPSLIANSDTAIGKLMNKLGYHMYFVNPSLVIHIAEHSTINHGGNGGRRNAWKPADHSLPLSHYGLLR